MTPRPARFQRAHTTRPMSTRIGSRPIFQLTPEELGERLELWALRREKVLQILDPRAARTARLLAARCRALVGSDPHSIDWLELRADVVRLLAEPGGARAA